MRCAACAVTRGGVARAPRRATGSLGTAAARTFGGLAMPTPSRRRLITTVRGGCAILRDGAGGGGGQKLLACLRRPLGSAATLN